MKCVEEELVKVLGQEGKKAIAYHLVSKGVNLTDSFDRPAQFINTLHMIFGNGSKLLERSFIQCIGGAIQIKGRRENLSDIVVGIRDSERLVR